MFPSVSGPNLSQKRHTDLSDDERVFLEHHSGHIQYVSHSHSHVRQTDRADMDGYARQMYSINGQYPGPLIEANEGDRIIVHLTNTLSEGQAIREWRFRL